jgi:hypothetical protein
MSWAIGYDEHWQRDIGYGVPALCDHPDCSTAIDRGLSFVCGNEPYGGDKGCGLYFCAEHQVDEHQRCERCAKRRKAFAPKPDTAEWLRWKLTDSSWQRWRDENPDDVTALGLSLLEAGE